MRENNLLSNKDYLRALEMPLGDEKPSKVKNGAYFADFALSEISARIGEQESDIYALTTLDQDLQEKASAILQKEIAAAKDKNVSQGAVVILDKNGAVRALVGGVNYNQSQFNRAVQALRQPGSAFKFFVYLAAIHQGLTPKDIIEDKPLIIKDWRPENHDKKYYGEAVSYTHLTLPTIYSV